MLFGNLNVYMCCVSTFSFNESSISSLRGVNYRTVIDSTGSSSITFTNGESTNSLHFSFNLNGQIDHDALSNFESADQIRIKYPDGSYWYEIGSAGCEDGDNEWRDKELKRAAQRHANCAADGGGTA